MYILRTITYLFLNEQFDSFQKYTKSFQLNDDWNVANCKIRDEQASKQHHHQQNTHHFSLHVDIFI